MKTKLITLAILLAATVSFNGFAQEKKTTKAKLKQIEIDIDINDNLITFLQEGTKKNVDGSENGLGIDQLIKTNTRKEAN